MSGLHRQAPMVEPERTSSYVEEVARQQWLEGKRGRDNRRSPKRLSPAEAAAAIRQKMEQEESLRKSAPTLPRPSTSKEGLRANRSLSNEEGTLESLIRQEAEKQHSYGGREKRGTRNASGASGSSFDTSASSSDPAVSDMPQNLTDLLVQSTSARGPVQEALVFKIRELLHDSTNLRAISKEAW
ncbi:hypothetical protein GUITHDRAFT_155256, partial [Guillardia theta CCMP2712]